MLLLDAMQGGAPLLGDPMTDYDYWKTDDGEKTSHPAPCSVCGEMFHDDELADGVCSKCEKEAALRAVLSITMDTLAGNSPFKGGEDDTE